MASGESRVSRRYDKENLLWQSTVVIKSDPVGFPVETLAKAGFSDNKRPKIKILGNGELTKKLTVKVPCSASAKAKIEKAGGSVA